MQYDFGIRVTVYFDERLSRLFIMDAIVKALAFDTFCEQLYRIVNE